MIEFFHSIEPSFWIKFALCVLCGLIVGVERQFHRKPIDIRTCVLICVGTMLFIYLGQNASGEKDATRVLGQVVTGIGFLGAGAIFTSRGHVIGLTSASVVWVLAAIGAAIGFGFYAIGIVVSVLTLLVVAGVQVLENFISSKAPNGAPNDPKRSPD